MKGQKRKAQVVVFARGFAQLHLLRLRTNERRGSFWQNITGSVEKSEDFSQGAVREMQEETGITAEESQVLELDPVFEFTDQWGKDVIEKCYLALIDFPREITIDPSEHQSYQWKEVGQVGPEDFKYESNFQVFQEALKRVHEIL